MSFLSAIRNILAWRRGSPVPPPGADLLGGATLPKPPPIPVHAIGDKPDARGGPVPEEAVALIMRWEGFKAEPYLCPANVPTIGYGSTRYADGRPVRMGDPPISRAEAEALLRRKAAGFAAAVDAMVKVPINRHQRAALVSFAYNVGEGALLNSTLLRHLNAGDAAGAAGQFERWTLAKGQRLAGLVNRRREEEALFRTV